MVSPVQIILFNIRIDKQNYPKVFIVEHPLAEEFMGGLIRSATGISDKAKNMGIQVDFQVTLMEYNQRIMFGIDATEMKFQPWFVFDERNPINRDIFDANEPEPKPDFPF